MEKFTYTPELLKAKKELFDYMEANNLSFSKDYSKDPIHGKEISLLLLKLNKERDKIMDQYPIGDIKNRMKLLTTKIRKSIMKQVKKAKGEKVSSKKKDLKKMKENIEKKEKAEKKASRKVATKYNYPLVDGREMTSAEKKKYRMEQRKLAAGQQPTSSEDKKKDVKKVKKNEPKVEKEKKDVKKKKKVKKEED